MFHSFQETVQMNSFHIRPIAPPLNALFEPALEETWSSNGIILSPLFAVPAEADDEDEDEPEEEEDDLDDQEEEEDEEDDTEYEDDEDEDEEDDGVILEDDEDEEDPEEDDDDEEDDDEEEEEEPVSQLIGTGSIARARNDIFERLAGGETLNL
jgi:hypothetical protein